MVSPVDPNSDFNTDNSDLITAAQAQQQAVADEKAALADFHNRVMAKLNNMKDAFLMLAYLPYVFQDMDGSGASVLGVMNAGLNIDGKSLDMNSILTKINNDLQKMTASDDSKDGSTVMVDVAKDLDTVLDELKNNSTLKNALNPAALSSLTENITTLRNQFYVVGDTAYNPTSGYKFSNDPKDAATCMTSFSQMQAQMQKTDDPFGATAEFKTLTDTFNANTSTTQSVGAAENVAITQLTSTIKAIIGFLNNGILKPPMDTEKTIQNNMKGG